MASGRPPRLRLFDILDAIHALRTALDGKGFDAFSENIVLQRAIENFGNKARHEYQSIHPRRVWETATLELGALQKVCATLYAEAKRPADPWPDAESK